MLILAVALGVPAAVGAGAGGGDFVTISHHTDRGRGFVAVATEVVVEKPETILLKIRNIPDVRVKAKYIIGCRSGEGERDNTHDSFKTKSTKVELPTLVPTPKNCLLYAEAIYDRPRSERRVKISMRVRADQRPGASPEQTSARR